MGKGTRRERQAVELLQSAGYATYRPATVAFGENDVFGLFDVLAVAPHLPPRAVQVKSNRANGIRSWMDHTALFRSVGFETEFWVCHDTKGWRVLRPDETGHTAAFDGRESGASMGDPLVQWLKDDAREET
jgi:Holliday junction resolvase